MDLSDCEILKDNSARSDVLFKVVLIGSGSVGKSCILLRAAKNEFKEIYSVTIGTDMCSIFIKYQERIIELQIWDTAGMEQFRSMIRVFFNGAHAVILVYDITRKETFDALDSWLKMAQETAPSDVKLLLVGNKSDDEENRQVSKEMGQGYMNNIGIEKYIETSAKTGQGIKDLFKKIAKELYLDELKTGSQLPGGQKLGGRTESKQGCC